MPKAIWSHPTEAELLRTADCELGDASVQDHLRVCEECRHKLDRLWEASQILMFDHQVVKRQAPPPPQPWFDIREQLRRLDAEPETPRMERLKPSTKPGRWAVAAAVTIIGLGVARLSVDPTVSAAELLEKASAKEKNNPRRGQIRIKKGGVSLLRPAVLSRNELRARTVTMDAGQQGIREQFEAAHFDWNDPLSAHAFSAWREGLSQKKDQVTVVKAEAGQDREYRIRTDAEEGTLAQVTLTLRAADMQAVNEVLEFRSGSVVEITEAEEVLPLPPPAQIARSGERASEVAASSAQHASELQVLAELHSIGADLGEPVEVTSSAEGPVVTLTGLSSTREKQIRSALAQLPDVIIQVHTLEPRRQSRAQQVLESDASPAVHTELEAKLGGRSVVESFVNSVLETSDGSLARAHALQNLALRFPIPREAQLSGEDRGLLYRLLQDHVAALAELTNKLASQLEPLVGPQPPPAAGADCPAWQLCAAELLPATQALDTALSATLASTDTARALDDLLVDVRNRFSRQRSALLRLMATLDKQQ